MALLRHVRPGGLVVLEDSDALTGMDIAVELNGGFDGRVVNGSNQPQTNFLVRAENMIDRRIHHNDVTKTEAIRLGQYSMSGLPLGPVRVVTHDPNYVLGDITPPGAQLVIAQAKAEITVSDLVQTWDGLPKPVSVTTDPPGLDVLVNYDGDEEDPADVGPYNVEVAIIDPNYTLEGIGVGIASDDKVYITQIVCGEMED